MQCKTCCRRCDGSGTVDGGEIGGPVEAALCDRCGGDGERRCDFEGCDRLALEFPANAFGDGFCATHAVDDLAETKPEIPVPMAVLVDGAA